MTQSTIGTVTLNVADLERQATFYQDIIGLQLQHKETNTAYLGIGEAAPLLILRETPDYKRYRRTTGLYHLAILVPSRYHLGLSLARLANTQTPLQGMSDHIVSEAIYLADPEGNGIEIYADRAYEAWFKNDEMQLATLPMDVKGVLSELEGRDNTWRRLPAGTIMGHIHLHVHSISAADQFYTGLLNMETMFNVGSALFLAYDGYHHHVGANIWAGHNIAPDDALGLAEFDLHLPQTQLDVILAQLEQSGTPITNGGNSYRVQDPSQNQVVLHPLD